MRDEAGSKTLIGAFNIQDPRNLEAIFDSITDMIAVVARDKTIVWANRAMKEAFAGRPVIGETCHAVLHATALAPTSCLTCDIFLTGKAIANDVYEPSLGGRWYNMCGFPVFDDQGTVVQVIHSFRDISERKRQEEANRQNDERYRRLIESVTDAVAVFDNEWRVQLINPTNLRIWEMTSDQVLGRSLVDIFPGIESTTVFVRLTMAMEERMPVVFTDQFIFPSGRSGQFEFRLYPVPGGLMSIVSDITERLTAQRLLEASERRLRELLETVKLIAVMLDNEGRITFLNRYFFELTGYGEDDVRGHDWFSICLPPAERDGVRRMFVQSLAAGNLPSHYENSLLTKSGEVREIFWNNTILRNPAGEIIGTASLGENVTEKNLARRRLEEAKEKAEATTRAKSEFLAMMSHDIRNPMNGVLGFIDLLQLTDLDDEQREYVQTIKSSGESLLGLINDILDFSRIESGKILLEPHPFNFRELVRETVRLFQSVAIGKSVRLSCEIDGALPEELVGDSLRFRQILQNLLGNALKFTASGEVGLYFSPEPMPGGQTIRVCGRVRDTGIGIPADRIGSLFQPFAQADPSIVREFGGTGLGLVISQRLCGLMGGRIEVESQVGRGSTFHFSMVMGVSSEACEVPESSSVEGLRTLGERMPLRILIVDDEPQNCRLTAGLLNQFGYKAECSDSSLQALRMMESRPFDLVFLDIRMPEVDGIEVARRLRAANADHPCRTAWVCALTAFAMDHERRQCLEAGMDDFQTKPVGLKELIAAIERAWNGLHARSGATSTNA